MNDDDETIEVGGEGEVVVEQSTDSTTEDKGSAESVAAATAAVASPPPTPRRDWRQEQMEKRIGKLTAEKNALADRLKALESASSSDDRLPASEIDRRAEARARELAAEQSFVTEAQRVAADGEKAFPDFGTKINSLSSIQTKGDPESEQAYRQLVQIAIETGEGAKVLYTLGSDPNEAARILALSPTRKAIELAKLASKAPPTESAAPRPITPLGNRGGTHSEISPDDPDRADKLSMKEWIKRRNKQIADQQKEEAARYGRQ